MGGKWLVTTVVRVRQGGGGDTSRPGDDLITGAVKRAVARETAATPTAEIHEAGSYEPSWLVVSATAADVSNAAPAMPPTIAPAITKTNMPVRR